MAAAATAVSDALAAPTKPPSDLTAKPNSRKRKLDIFLDGEETPPRRTLPFRDRGHAAAQPALSISSEFSDGSSSRQSSEGPLARKDATYAPSECSSSGSASPAPTVRSWRTPERNIDGGDPRPPRQPLINVSPGGETSVLTGYGNELRDLEDTHVVGRATAPYVEAGFEKFMDIPYFHPDCTSNRLFFGSSHHSAIDARLCGWFPDIPVLRRMNAALRRRPILPLGSGSRKPLPRNKNGITHHTLVFPPGPWKCRFSPLSTWKRVPIECVDGTYRVPFEQPEDRVPKRTIHCSPYYIVWQTYLALSKTSGTAPRYLEKHAALIMENGRLMETYMRKP